MTENQRTEAEIVHDIPEEVAAGIGRVMIGTSKLEHKLTAMIGLILQLDKTEMHLTLREPRIEERLDIIKELFMLKAIEPEFNFEEFKKTLQSVGSRRHRLAHGLWLQHPKTGELFLRLARGSWPKNLLPHGGVGKLRRDTLPQSIPYGADELKEDLSLIEEALERLDELGAALDYSLSAFPERFRTPLSPVNPLGGHKPRERPAPPKPSEE